MERPRQLADELNKAQKRIVLWVGETSAENILATKDLAKSVRVEHISSNDAKELLPLFEGTATVQSTCFVIKVDDTDILVTARSNPHWKASRGVVIYGQGEAPRPSANPRTTVATSFAQALEAVQAWVTNPPAQ